MDEKDRIITAIYNDTRAKARSVTALSCLSPLSSTTLQDPSPDLSFSPGPTETGFSRSACGGSSLSQNPPCLQKAPGSCPRARLGETCIGPLLAAGPGLHISLHMCNKLIFRLLLDSVLRVTHLLPTLHWWSSDPQSTASRALRPLSLAAAGGGRLRPRPASACGPVGSACLGHMSLLPASPSQAPCRPRCPPSPPPPLPPAACSSRSSSRRRGAALHCLRPGLGRGPRRSRPLRPAPGPGARARAMGLWLPPSPAPPG